MDELHIILLLDDFVELSQQCIGVDSVIRRVLGGEFEHELVHRLSLRLLGTLRRCLHIYIYDIIIGRSHMYFV
jgi:hypothetical protein